MTVVMDASSTHLSYEDVCAFLYREARLLDDKEWEAWLDCYAADVEYFAPNDVAGFASLRSGPLANDSTG